MHLVNVHRMPDVFQRGLKQRPGKICEGQDLAHGFVEFALRLDPGHDQFLQLDSLFGSHLGVPLHRLGIGTFERLASSG